MKKHFFPVLTGTLLALAILMLAPKMALAGTVTYTVPVADALKPYAQFNLPAQITKTESGVTLSYQMPEELVGPIPVTVTMTSSDFIPEAATFTLSGPQGQATCQYANDSTTCNVQFSNLNIDPVAVAANLRQKITNAAELDNRLLVGRIFSADPVGVIVYDDSLSYKAMRPVSN